MFKNTSIAAASISLILAAGPAFAQGAAGPTPSIQDKGASQAQPQGQDTKSMSKGSTRTPAAVGGTGDSKQTATGGQPGGDARKN